MALKEYLRVKKRKSASDPETLTTQNELLRAILENLVFANRLNILQAQFVLLETDQAASGVRRAHTAQLAETVKKLLNETTTQEELT